MVAEVLKIKEGTDPHYKTTLDPDPETLKQFKVKPAETEPDNELMDEDTEGEPDSGSPLDLVYPLEESSTTVGSEEQTIVIPMDPAEIEEMAKEKWEVRPERESVSGTKEQEQERRSQGVQATLQRSITNIDYLAEELDCLQVEQQMTIMDSLAKLGLLQVSYDMTMSKEAGEAYDPAYWKKHVVEALRDKQEAAESLLIQKVEEPDKEDEMDTHQDPPSSPYQPPELSGL